ncbi:hydantoinase [candidate division KSB1 bacterium]|nr:hydantoinase [candidate division KSB1 bacterium]
MQGKIKIGIDVGGTFTHAVAVDAETLTVVAKALLPTTHTASEGVARGVVEVMKKLLHEGNIDVDQVALIAHSTTQATNALLEGDVAAVGIVGLGRGLEAARVRRETRIGDIELASGRFIRTFYRFIDSGKKPESSEILSALRELQGEGAQAIVASESFGVDNPENEEQVIACAREIGLPATAASQISQLYGLKIRTRTAVINASMLPKMLETVNMTEKSVRAAGIQAPLMVMRSDGGIMDIEEMRRRPILTMLSGPAAGVAAALMYARISDGIFIEVGGTSSDISAIRNGRPIVKSARIGNHRLYIRTLDVRTEGIAGGSMPRLRDGQLIDVGPRSAHIAGAQYPAFSNLDKQSLLQVKTVQPLPNDPDDYVQIVDRSDSQVYTLTPTDAANALDWIPVDGYGRGNLTAIFSVLERVADKIGSEPLQLAKNLLQIACSKVIAVVEALCKEYKFDRELLRLVGGGGGASAIVPFTAQQMGLDYVIADNSEVISAIGAALGIIRDSIERTIINPSEKDLLQLRQRAIESVQKMGALPDSIQVTIDVDRQTKRVIATATGASEMRFRELGKEPLQESELQSLAAESLKCEPDAVECVGKTALLTVWNTRKIKRRLWGLLHQESNPLRVLDSEGIIRLQLSNADVWQSTAQESQKIILKAIDLLTAYGDAGALLPDIFILYGRKVVDLGGLVEKKQVLALTEIECRDLNPDEPLVVIAAAR